MGAVERGEKNITLAMVNKVAKALKISLADYSRASEVRSDRENLLSHFLRNGNNGINHIFLYGLFRFFQ